MQGYNGLNTAEAVEFRFADGSVLLNRTTVSQYRRSSYSNTYDLSIECQRTIDQIAPDSYKNKHNISSSQRMHSLFPLGPTCLDGHFILSQTVIDLSPYSKGRSL